MLEKRVASIRGEQGIEPVSVEVLERFGVERDGLPGVELAALLLDEFLGEDVDALEVLRRIGSRRS